MFVLFSIYFLNNTCSYASEEKEKNTNVFKGHFKISNVSKEEIDKEGHTKKTTKNEKECGIDIGTPDIGTPDVGTPNPFNWFNKK